MIIRCGQPASWNGSARFIEDTIFWCRCMAKALDVSRMTHWTQTENTVYLHNIRTEWHSNINMHMGMQFRELTTAFGVQFVPSCINKLGLLFTKALGPDTLVTLWNLLTPGEVHRTGTRQLPRHRPGISGNRVIVLCWDHQPGRGAGGVARVKALHWNGTLVGVASMDSAADSTGLFCMLL